MKKASLAFLSLLFVLTAGLSAHAVDGVVHTTETIGGATAQVVYVTLKENRALVPLIANNSMCTDAPVSAVLSSAKGGTVVAAVNGGFFNSYYDTSRALSVSDGNYPRVYSTVVADGRVVCAGGEIAAVGMDYSGKVYIDLVKLTPTVTFRGDTVVSAWGVNTVYNDPTAVYVLTDLFDYPVDIPASSKIVAVRDNKVVSVSDGTGGYVTPDGVTAVVYGATAYANAASWDKEPLAGESAVFHYTAEPSDAADRAAWNNMRTVVGGGGVLVQNGANRVDYAGNPTAADQGPDVVGQRSFAALMKDGRLLFGTVKSSFRSIADSLISLGAVDAVFLDGGASSMLYCDGAMVTSAGRRLATVLAVVDETAPANAPDLSVPADAMNGDKPSSWAQSSVDAARQAGILPQSLDGNFQRDITRKEFCDLIAAFLRVKTGSSIEYICTKNEITVPSKPFSDSNDYYVPFVAALGIVTGYPDGTFRPGDSIQRQDAAIMLGRLADFLEAPGADAGKTFTDSDAIAGYARPGVDFVTGLGIMNGNANGTFAPLAHITREQAIITIMNAFDCL